MGFSNQKITFTWWFVLILFMLIWPMFVGPYIALNNPTFFVGSEVTLSSSLYIARNLAVGLAFLVAIFMRNASMLFILILVRLITDLIDAPVFFSFKEPNLIGLIFIFSLCCYLPAILGLHYLWQHNSILESKLKR
tara:strand:- start:97 stop:504 length:408 start_codon:yes stop_codon:yes gene_type:complete